MKGYLTIEEKILLSQTEGKNKTDILSELQGLTADDKLSASICESLINKIKTQNIDITVEKSIGSEIRSNFY